MIEIEIVGKILLGLGLMFTGVQMLSLGLKQLGSRQFRKLATQVVSSRRKALLFGLGAGAIMQSTSAALMILASLITAGLLNVSRAIAILIGFSVGNTALLFVIALNIDEAVMYIVGVCGIAMYLVKNEKYRNSLLIGMGLGLIFFGIETMTAGVKPLSHETWFTGAMTFSCNYPFLSIIAGTLLGFIAQSSTAVALVAIGLAKENILTGPQTFLFMYGAAIGSTMFKVLLGQSFRGTSLQLVKFVNMFNFFGAAVFILLYYIEVYLFSYPIGHGVSELSRSRPASSGRNSIPDVQSDSCNFFHRHQQTSYLLAGKNAPAIGSGRLVPSKISFGFPA